MNPYAAPEIRNSGIPLGHGRVRVPFSQRLQDCCARLRACHPRRWTGLTLLVVALWMSYGIIRNWSSPDPARISLDTRQVQTRLVTEMNDVSPLPTGWPFFAVRPIGWFTWDSNFSPATPAPTGPIADFFPVVALLNFFLITVASVAIVYHCQNRRRGRPVAGLLFVILLVFSLSLVAHWTDHWDVKLGLDWLVNLAYFLPAFDVLVSIAALLLFGGRQTIQRPGVEHADVQQIASIQSPESVRPAAEIH